MPTCAKLSGIHHNNKLLTVKYLYKDIDNQSKLLIRLHSSTTFIFVLIHRRFKKKSCPASLQEKKIAISLCLPMKMRNNVDLFHKIFLFRVETQNHSVDKLEL